MLKKGRIKEVMHGVELGIFPALVCGGCGESFTDDVTTKKIQSAAKKKGVWGLGMKTKVTKAGNSIAVRVPKAIAAFLDLKPGQEAYIHPEKNKLILEKY